MQELTVNQQMALTGGGAAFVLICVIVGVGLYKILRSRRGNIGVGRLFRLEWR